MADEDLDTNKAEPKMELKPNRLISEKSPYLRQHACNPVNWFPWGEDAFQLAKKEDRPVFLSVGYSTCHWCHVMAHESFEDTEVARLMNEAFVSIKVDREERPDIDRIYMAAAQMITGRGGWPLTVIMTADKKPFFAATYIPKTGRFGQMGMLELIPRIKEMWTNKRDQLLSDADRITDYLRQSQKTAANQRPKDRGPDISVLKKGYESLESVYDIENGGFGYAPKFPTPHNLMFLLRYWRRSRDESALDMVNTTLQAMRMGGIYDHIGFGFHRYSTDAQWFVPHFEKMLYDQALLAVAYAEAFQATRKAEFAKTLKEILEYVRRDMTSPEGGFYSAEDADSEGEEGRFYTWTAQELKGLLEKDEMGLLIRLLDISESGNFEKGRNILRQRTSVEDASQVLRISEKELQGRLDQIREKLFLAREKRIRPGRDDKILADWNGLMIAAFSRGAQVLGDSDYVRAARRAADFILREMKGPEGRLLHRYKEGAGIEANLDDYAFLAWGLIELYEASFDAAYLREALEITASMIEHFWDDFAGGLFFTPDDGEALLVRSKEIYDGALPSGNSVAMMNLLRLSHITGDASLEEKASALASAFGDAVSSQPLGHTMFLTSLDYAIGPSYEVALVGGPEDDVIRRMLEAVRSRFLPNKSVILVSGEEIRNLAQFTRNLVMQNGKATAYVCANYSCDIPTNDPQRMIEILEEADGAL